MLYQMNALIVLFAFDIGLFGDHCVFGFTDILLG